jgi:hypothetical protein
MFSIYDSILFLRPNRRVLTTVSNHMISSNKVYLWIGIILSTDSDGKHGAGPIRLAQETPYHINK